MQGYFTLQEAAQFLDMDADELKQMAQRKEIRSFQDRGTLRFRVQDVQELGRRRGTTSSDPDLVMGDAALLTPKSGPKSPPKGGPKSPSSPRTPSKREPLADDAVGIGKEVLGDVPGGSKKSGPKSPPTGQARKSGQRSPQPQAGSTSDVKLASEAGHSGSDSDVKLIGHDSDVKIADSIAKTPKVVKTGMAGPDSPPQKKSGPSTPQPATPKPDSAPKKYPGRPASAAQPADSGVRLVPMDSDSDVKIVGAGSDEVTLGASPAPSASDSDIRLEKYHLPPRDSGDEEMVLTEEINLDEELRKQEAALQQPPAKVKPKSHAHHSPITPPQQARADAAKPSSAGSKSGARPKGKTPSDSSSDFDLTPASDDSVLLRPDSSDDFSLQLADDSALGGEPAGLSGPSSGISLNNPVDAGISLEEGSPEASDVDFDLSLEVEATPKPAKAGPADSDSEFELSLDADDSGPQAAAGSPADSDSEFELTLDDSGGLAPMEAEDATQRHPESVEKDIFETDFEVPALEDDSGSQVAALETDMDSSDFDIALDDSAIEEGSASQVVALDEEADEAAATRADDEGVVVAEEDAGLGGLEVADEDLGVAEVDEAFDDVKTVAKDRFVQPAPWGALPVVFMLPCVIVMIVVGLLGFELVQSTGGYKSPGFLTKTIGDLIGKPIK